MIEIDMERARKNRRSYFSSNLGDYNCEKQTGGSDHISFHRFRHSLEGWQSGDESEAINGTEENMRQILEQGGYDSFRQGIISSTELNHKQKHNPGLLHTKWLEEIWQGSSWPRGVENSTLKRKLQTKFPPIKCTTEGKRCFAEEYYEIRRRHGDKWRVRGKERVLLGADNGKGTMSIQVDSKKKFVTTEAGSRIGKKKMCFRTRPSKIRLIQKGENFRKRIRVIKKYLKNNLGSFNGECATEKLSWQNRSQSLKEKERKWETECLLEVIAGLREGSVVIFLEEHIEKIFADWLEKVREEEERRRRRWSLGDLIQKLWCFQAPR